MQKLHVFNRIYIVLKTLTFKVSGLLTSRNYPIALSGMFLLLLAPHFISAQQKTRIILQGSEKSRTLVKEDITYLRKPIFKQDNAILTCDSAVFYSSKNYFEAYNNVHINQADTINIYSDRLTYDGNAKIAHLSSNVRLQDRTSTLTTNILDYNMGSKVGTYVSGGKIVNKEATITSKNGYYFANTRDAYFRYNVLVVTEQSTIKSDTLRYNTLSNWAYFYGPTNIKEKDGNLYTENGAYNTKTTYAYFGKNNLYTSGSRSLKGDSLYYDGVAGYGKAVRNIIFKDTVDKMVMHGQLAFYYKKDQRTLVTKNAYAGIGTTDSILLKDVKQPDSLWLGADTLETQMVLVKSLKLIKGPVIKKDNELGEEARDESVGLSKTKGKTSENQSKNPSGSPVKDKERAAPDGKRKPKGAPKSGDPKQAPKQGDSKQAPPAGRDSLANNQLRKDSLKVPVTINKGDSTLKSLKRDSTIKGDSALKAKILKPIKIDSLNKSDTLKKGTGVTDSLTAKNSKGKKTLTAKDTIPFNPMDTALTRAIKAYHHVNVFKSNMQAKADSLFYTSGDSTLRWYKNPILWAQGSQQTGDTIYLQLRNKKVNSVQIIQNAFAVNVDTDSTKFNQIKGKLITGFFKEGKLHTMYVDGNAESVYFTKTDDGKKYDKLNQTISSRIKIIFKGSEISEVVPIKNVEGLTKPVAEMKADVILTGFIWKPELRPRSKKDVTNPKPALKKAKVKKAPKTKSGVIAAGTKILNDAKGKKIPAGLMKQVIKKADSLSAPGKIPGALIDTATKALPGLMKKADSLSKLPVPLKKQ